MTLFFKNLLFTILVPGTFALLLPILITAGRSPASGYIRAVAVILISFGVAIYVRCIWDFLIYGRGTPLPLDAPKGLVIRGIYLYIRNPMYSGVLMVILGWSIFFQDAVLVVYTVIIGTIFHLFVVLYEEPHLQQTFGDEYKNYCKQVGRWLPKIRRKRNA